MFGSSIRKIRMGFTLNLLFRFFLRGIFIYFHYTKTIIIMRMRSNHLISFASRIQISVTTRSKDSSVLCRVHVRLSESDNRCPALMAVPSRSSSDRGVESWAQQSASHTFQQRRKGRPTSGLWPLPSPQ